MKCLFQVMALLIALHAGAALAADAPKHKHAHAARYQWRGKGDIVRLVPIVPKKPVYLNSQTYSPYGYTPIPSTDYYVPPPAYLPPESGPDVSGPEPKTAF
jgi:hypothetical protein